MLLRQERTLHVSPCLKTKLQTRPDFNSHSYYGCLESPRQAACAPAYRTFPFPFHNGSTPARADVLCTSGERLSLEIAKKINQAQTPALSQVLYFSEVTAKRRETARRDRARESKVMGRKGTVNHWSKSLRRQVLKVKKSPGERSAATASAFVSFCVSVLQRRLLPEPH